MDKSDAPGNLVMQKNRLFSEIVQFRSMQIRRFPGIVKYLVPIDPLTPQLANLHLPSSFPQHIRDSSELAMKDAAAVEYSLREGAAHDALDALRTAIRTHNHIFGKKLVNSRGQAASTRSQAYLNAITSEKHAAARKYQRARSALRLLGMPASDKTFQLLDFSQLYGKNTAAPSRLGDSKRPDPWFWTVGRPSKMTTVEEKEWEVESMLIH